MPRVSSIEVLNKNEQPILSIRTRTGVKELPRLIGDGYGKMAAYLQEIGECLSDIPFVCYHNMDMENLDVEIGFPVVKQLPGKDDKSPVLFPLANPFSACTAAHIWK